MTTRGLPELPGLPGNIPSPMEVVDAALDSVGEVLLLGPRMAANLGQSVAATARKIEGDIRQPIDEGGIPASPGTVISGGIGVVVDVVSGGVNVVGEGLESIRQTADGVKGQLDALVRR